MSLATGPAQPGEDPLGVSSHLVTEAGCELDVVLLAFVVLLGLPCVYLPRLGVTVPRFGFSVFVPMEQRMPRTQRRRSRPVALSPVLRTLCSSLTELTRLTSQTDQTEKTR
jgi:hypothetical protein